MKERSRYRGEHLLLVTGKLAEPLLRRMAPALENRFGLGISIQVMPITVAALMPVAWIAARIRVPEGCQRVVIPGWCSGDLEVLQARAGVPVEAGPRDLRDLPEWLGGKTEPVPLDRWSIEIIAEINHAPHRMIRELIDEGHRLVSEGANVIDLGCVPGETWQAAGEAVAALVGEGLRVSIDSLNVDEIAIAAEAGASLVLSVNSSNREAAAAWGCEVVAIPDTPDDDASLQETMEYLSAHSVPFRIDPILEPIGFGFAASLLRYFRCRQRWPEVPMMMGIGNLTELTDVDSAGVNFLLLAICEELEIRSVLTTQVINWARSSVRECDLARRMVHASIHGGFPPKNLDSRLVCLRDPRVRPALAQELTELATAIRDWNYRIAVSEDALHVMGGGRHWSHEDAFAVFQNLLNESPAPPDASHAFYLGYELCKAHLARQLGKQYEQDQALRWGHLTREEESRHRLERSPGPRSRKPGESDGDDV